MKQPRPPSVWVTHTTNWRRNMRLAALDTLWVRMTAVLMVTAAAQPLAAQCSPPITAAAAGGRIAPARAALEKSAGATRWTDSAYHCMGSLLERELKWADAQGW